MMKMAWAWCAVVTGVRVGASERCRDRWLEPFSSDSIWNTAIGSGANFKAANLFADGDWRGMPGSFHNDQDFVVRTTHQDPLTTWINQGDWDPDTAAGGKCGTQKHPHSGKPCGSAAGLTDGCITQIRLPKDWTSATDCDGPASASGGNCRSPGDQKNNNAMALLLPDNETLVQMQPAYRCGFYPKPLLARWGNATDGGPTRFPNVTSIFGAGTYGAHGGSGLSSLGGSIRLGELLPGGSIAHALKIELTNWWYYSRAQLQPPTVENDGHTQYVWPATGSNGRFSNATGTAGTYNGTDRFLAPGALLAIPASQADSVKTTTPIGTKIKQAMVDYGSYIVDGAGHGPSPEPNRRNHVAICMDALVNAEMRRHYNFSMTYPAGVSAPGLDPKQTPAANQLFNDLLRIFRALHIVTNNRPGRVGGGGTPRHPPKPAICGAPAP